MIGKKAQFTQAERDFQSYVEGTKIAVDKEFQGQMAGTAEPRLCAKIAEFLSAQDSHLPSTLLMLSAESVGARSEDVLKLALSVDLLYAAALAHNCATNQNSAWKSAVPLRSKRCVDDAILVGDALMALSVSLTADYGREIIDTLAVTSLMLSDGNYIDSELSDRLMTEAEHMERTKKSARLFRNAMRCGAMAGSGLVEEVEGLTVFGENFGMAYVVRNEVSEVVSFCNRVPTDVSRLRSSLPLVHLCESSNADNRQLLLSRLGFMGEASADLQAKHVREALQNSDALSYCNGKIEEFALRAVSTLDCLRGSVYKHHLVHLARALI